MSLTQSLLTFAAFAALLTITPGLDTVLVLRTAAVGGPRPAYAAACGIGLGCLCWAVAGGLGITAVLHASRVAYEVLRWAGAAYLVYLGVRMLWRRQSTVDGVPEAPEVPEVKQGNAFRVGLTTNLLNPKVGVFYVSVLPQFLPDGVTPLLGSTALAGVHVIEGLLWSAAVIVAVHRTAGWFSRPQVRRRLDQVTGVVFVALGVRLAAESLRR